MFASKSMIQQSKNTFRFRNLVMLFFTIVFGLGSVMVLAGQLTIENILPNARQTIMRVTITDDGTDDGNVLMDMNNASGKIYINTSMLAYENAFTGKVLGLDNNGNMIYIPATGLSSSITGSVTDDDWTITGNNIYRMTGAVGIGTPTPTGIFDVNGRFILSDTVPYTSFNNTGRNGGSNDVAFIVKADGTGVLMINEYGQMALRGIDENSALSLRRTDSSPYALLATNNGHGFLELLQEGSPSPYAYIASSGTSYFNGGNVDINTSISLFTMDGKLNVAHSGGIEIFAQEMAPGHAANIHLKNTVNTWLVGGFSDFFYVGMGSSAFLTVMSGGNVGVATANPKVALQVSGSFIAGDYGNNAYGTFSTVMGGESNNTYANNAGIIGGTTNSITTNAIGSFIGGGNSNTISGTSTYSSIIGGRDNKIENAAYSFVGGTKARNTGNANTFVRNADSANYFYAGKNNSFLINVPFSKGVKGGVGINTNNPQSALDVSGDITAKIIYGDRVSTDQMSTMGIQLLGVSVSTGAGCSSSSGGTIIYTGGSFYGCNGSIWKQLDN